MTVQVDADGWTFAARRFPYLQRCKDRTIYHWTGSEFEPVSRFTTSLIKLVPTDWGPPTFEIDGIKMLPTAHVSPYADAERKVALIEPRGKRILDTCGGLGYFAAWCLQARADAHRVVRKERRRAVAAELEPVVAECGAAFDARERRRGRARSPRCRAIRSTPRCTTRRASESPASSTRRRFLRRARASAQARRAAVSLHRRTEQAHERARSRQRSEPALARQQGLRQQLDGDGVLAKKKVSAGARPYEAKSIHARRRSRCHEAEGL